MPKTKDALRKPLRAGIGKALKGLHYPLDGIVLRVRPEPVVLRVRRCRP
ncbi:hypothetical protein ACQKRQ_02245 [Paraburkholderia sp. NPDC080076]